jgi:hypothetical protein
MKEVEGYGITKTDGRALLHLAAWVHERINKHYWTLSLSIIGACSCLMLLSVEDANSEAITNLLWVG